MVKYYIAGDRGLVGTWYKKKYPDALGGNTQTANYNSRISTKQDFQLRVIITCDFKVQLVSVVVSSTMLS